MTKKIPYEPAEKYLTEAIHVGQTKKLCNTCHYLSSFGNMYDQTKHICLNMECPGKIIEYPHAATCLHWEEKDYLLEKQIAEPPMFNPITVTVEEVKIHLTDDKPQTYKADGGKAELRLAPSQIMHYIAIAKKYGNEKYGAPDSWMTVDPDRWIDAMLRHALAFAENPYSVDEESGLPHLFHLDCNCAFLSEFYKRGAFKK
jgi:hypothetical protein